jgi:hypothetical protein
MRSLASSVHNVSKISGFLNKLFNKTQKVNIGLIGDSTVGYNGHGWDGAQPYALRALGLQRHGTGILGAGDVVAWGEGSDQDALGSNAIPYGTSASNGFTSHAPAEWRDFLSNWGDTTATTDATRTNTGALQPFLITASNYSTSSFGFTILGNDTIAHTQPFFEGLTASVTFQHWYAITDAAINGKTGVVRVRKQTDQKSYNVFSVNNFDGITGGSFAIRMGLTTTAGITFTTNANTLAARIVAAITGAFAGFTSGNCSVNVSEPGTALPSGDMHFRIVLGEPAAGIDVPPLGSGPSAAGFSGDYELVAGGISG